MSRSLKFSTSGANNDSNKQCDKSRFKWDSGEFGWNMSDIPCNEFAAEKWAFVCFNIWAEL